jgi:hypothetical protein
MQKIQSLVFGALLLIGGIAHADSAPDCTTPEAIARTNAQIESYMASVEAGQQKREAEINEVISAKAAANNWSEDQQGAFLEGLLESPEFDALAKEMEPYMVEVMQMAQASGEDEDKAICMNALRLMEILQNMSKLSDRQFDFMLNAIKTAK